MALVPAFSAAQKLLFGRALPSVHWEDISKEGICDFGGPAIKHIITSSTSTTTLGYTCHCASAFAVPCISGR